MLTGQAGMPDLQSLICFIHRLSTSSTYLMIFPDIEEIASPRTGLAMTIRILIKSSVGAEWNIKSSGKIHRLRKCYLFLFQLQNQILVLEQSNCKPLK